MFNIINHQGNANKTIMGYHVIPARMAIIKKAKITTVGKDMEKMEPSCTVGGNVS